MSAPLKINEEEISHELIDGEVVIIQFGTGNYYSLSGPAAAVWQRLASGASAADLLALFSDAPSAAADDIAAFLSDLSKENLLKPAEAVSAAVPAAAIPYVKPVLNKYTDMQQLLLADPLHEVEEAGWPHTKPPEA